MAKILEIPDDLVILDCDISDHGRQKKRRKKEKLSGQFMQNYAAKNKQKRKILKQSAVIIYSFPHSKTIA